MRDLGSVFVGETVRFAGQWVTVVEIDRDGDRVVVMGTIKDGRQVMFVGEASYLVKVKGEK